MIEPPSTAVLPSPGQPAKTARVAFITGASRGIGAATALAFGRAGWRLALAARSVDDNRPLPQQLRRPDGQLLAGSLRGVAQALAQAQASAADCLCLPMDLMDSASLDKAVDSVLAHFGRVDVLINNAVYQDRESNALLAGLDDEALMRTLAGNVVAPLRLVRRLLPTLLAQGGGTLINVCSGAGKADPPLPADQGGWGFAYGASKAALARMAGCLNTEHGAQGVRAFSVNPGLVTTEAVTATLGDGGALQQRFGAVAPETIAQALLWMAEHPQSPQLQALAARPGMIDLQPLARELRLG